MTSDFYFTATSWFPGNVRVKPHSKHSGGRGHWFPQYFADQLTLFEPGRADYPHLSLLAPPQCFSSSGITAGNTYILIACHQMFLYGIFILFTTDIQHRKICKQMYYHQNPLANYATISNLILRWLLTRSISSFGTKMNKFLCSISSLFYNDKHILYSKDKVIYTKCSKPKTLYCGTHNWLCVQKMLNHGWNHGFFL